MATDQEFAQILSEGQAAFILYMRDDLGLRIDAALPLALQILTMASMAIATDPDETLAGPLQKVRADLLASHPDSVGVIDWVIEVIKRDAFVQSGTPDNE